MFAFYLLQHSRESRVLVQLFRPEVAWHIDLRIIAVYHGQHFGADEFGNHDAVARVMLKFCTRKGFEIENR